MLISRTSSKLKPSGLQKTLLKIKTSSHRLKKIFVKHVSDKGLIFKIYKELSKLNYKKANIQIKTWQKI